MINTLPKSLIKAAENHLCKALNEDASNIFRNMNDVHWMNTADVIKMAAPIPTYINDQEYDSLWDDLTKNGMDTPLEISVSSTHARLDSGNHRIQLFSKNGISKVPVSIKETDHVIHSPDNGMHIGITIEDFSKIDPR